VDVVVYRIRQKLARHGIGIVSIHGFGYRLSEGARGRTRKLLAAYGADIIDAVTPNAS